jgi:hypothetical protein
MVLTLLADALPEPAQVQYPWFEPSFLVPMAQPDAGTETGREADTPAANALPTAALVLMGYLLPMQIVSVETELDGPGPIWTIKETDVQPLIAPARFVSVAMMLGPEGVLLLLVVVVVALGAVVWRGKGIAGPALVKPIRQSRATARIRLLVATILKRAWETVVMKDREIIE